MTDGRVRMLRASFPVREGDRPVVGVPARDAVFVRLDREGRSGFGECAPLGGSDAALGACERALEAWASAGASGDAAACMAPPARVAACAALEPLAGFGAAANAPVGAAAYFGAGPAALDDAALDRLRHGAAIKVKIGRAPAAEERRMLERILRDIPGTRLRLDGNRGMRLDDCVALVHGLPVERFEYLEEPVADPSDLGRLRDCTGIDVALDELVVDASAEARDLRDRLGGGACAWVIRLSRIGSLDEVRRTMRIAASRGCDPVLSTAYQSSWTIRLAAHLARSMDATGRPHGLGTADVLDADACVPATLASGCVPCGPLPVPLEGRW
ncbi:MAG: enolase C-terminal domain-like protein [Phycisphaerales bacterium]